MVSVTHNTSAGLPSHTTRLLVSRHTQHVCWSPSHTTRLLVSVTHNTSAGLRHTQHVCWSPVTHNTSAGLRHTQHVCWSPSHTARLPVSRHTQHVCRSPVTHNTSASLRHTQHVCWSHTTRLLVSVTHNTSVTHMGLSSRSSGSTAQRKRKLSHFLCSPVNTCFK